MLYGTFHGKANTVIKDMRIEGNRILGELKNSVTVRKVIDALKKEGLWVYTSFSEDMPIEDICYDSRKAVKGCLFICKGKAFREEYLKEALVKGACCYVAGCAYNIDFPHIIVSDERKALGIISRCFYLQGQDSPKIIVITGTKGKTTTCFMLRALLEAKGIKCALSTTIELFDGVEYLPANLTTPESNELYSLIARAIKNNCEAIIIEASSAAYSMDRLYGMDVTCGIFLNITPDHISANEHSSFREYYMCKYSIICAAKKVGICIDDEYGAVMAANLRKQGKEVLTYSTSKQDADVLLSHWLSMESGIKMDLRHPSGEDCLILGIPGEHNMRNALGAFTAGCLMGIKDGYAGNPLEDIHIPGRMEIIEGSSVTVIVDYAHNKVSMDSLLCSIKDSYPQRDIIAVFGCSGNKVPQRREDMAYTAAKYAYKVYITEDNQAFESPYSIALQIGGFLDKKNCDYTIEIDRAKAIALAVKEAKEGDIIVIAGKGAEQFQRVKGKTLFYQGDIASARIALGLGNR